MLYITIALQAFCIYHVFKHKNEYYWVFLILFIPVIGSLIYLFTQVFNKTDINGIQKQLTEVITPSHKVQTLEKKLAFSDTYQNRVDLADAYFEIKNYEKAIQHFNKAILDTSQNNTYIIKQLIICFYKTNAFKSVIEYSKKITSHKDFKGSTSQFYYGLALYASGDYDRALSVLEVFDKPYCNYDKRLHYAKLMLEQDKKTKAINLLKELQAESEYMTKPNKKRYKSIVIEVNNLLQSL